MIPREDNEDHRPTYRATYTMTVTITTPVYVDGTEADSDRTREELDGGIEPVLKRVEAMGYGVDIVSEIKA